jgi:5-methylcytosine-specific restriction endonuclease McrA
MTRLRACVQCGVPCHGSRCPAHALPPRDRARASQKMLRQIAASATHCAICGEGPRPGDPFVAHHVVPRAHHGSDDPSNLAGAHASCNGRKGAHLGNSGAWSR